MTDTVHLGLPYIETAQAQKHVTHNEALRALDALVMLSVLDRDLSAPPAEPEEGDRYLVKPAGTGAFAGMDNRVAHFVDGEWSFFVPRAGWVCYVADEGALLAHNGEEWAAALDVLGGVSELQELALLGIATEADATNPLSAKLNNALWTARTVAEGGDGDLRYKLSKEADSNTLSMLFQTAYSGRAEIGLTGDDDLHFKVSADGTDWTDALLIDKATGAIKINAGFFLTGDVSPTTLGANQNDYDPTDLPTASVLRLASDASRNITGLSGGADGRIVAIVNVGSNPIVLKDADAASSAGNRFSFGADVTLGARKSAVLWYDASDSRWRLLAGPAASGGGGGGPADLDIVLAEMAMQAADNAGAAMFWGSAGNRFADSFDALTYVDTAAATNLDSGTPGLLKPTTSSDSYSDAVDVTLNSNEAGWPDYTVRLRIPSSALANVAGDKIRVTLSPPTSGNNTPVLSAYVGHKGAGAQDFDGNQVRLTFSGNNNVTLVAGGSSVVSDAATFTYDHTKDLIVAIKTATGSVDLRKNNSPGAGYYQYYKSAVDETASTTVSGYSTDGTNRFGVVDRVEVRTAPGAANNLTVAATALTAASVPSTARLAARSKFFGSVTLNTDLLFDVSRDGGTTWSTFSMSDCFTSPSPMAGIHVLEGAALDISGQPSGSSMKWRARTANNKNLELHDIYLAWE